MVETEILAGALAVQDFLLATDTLTKPYGLISFSNYC